MALTPTSGTKLYIGTQAANATTDTYVEIGAVTALGEFSDRDNLVTAITLGDARVRKSKGSSNAGQLQPQIIFDAANAGQQALITAGALKASAGGSTPYNFKIELADEPPTGPDPAPTTILLKGFVMGAPISVGNADEFTRLSATIEIDTIVSIAYATADATP